MEIVPLEQVIRQYVALPSQSTGTGWYPVLCKVCNDRGHKGPRAGFKFDEGKIAYHCFNCGHAIVYDNETQYTMPEKMVEVLNAFSIPEDAWKSTLIKGLQNKDAGIKSARSEHQIVEIEPTVVPLPNTFYPLAEASPKDKWAQIARDYLEYERGVDPNSYPFYLAHKTGNKHLDHWFKRIIIPVYKENNLIFYFGRDLTGKNKQKYLSPSFSKEKLFYGFDELTRETGEPLYIVEGWFDAFAINGIAILGNEISKPQTIWFNRTQRKKIYIPDRRGDGWVAAENAIENGWSISTPDIGNCKDINEAVVKYGKLYVIKSIVEHILDPTVISKDLIIAQLEFYCTYDSLNKDRTNKKGSKKKDSSSS